MSEELALLSQKFDKALFDAYRRAKIEANYNATIFYGMLTTRGGRDTAKYLINSSKPSDGYTALYERERLDLTVEAIVLENPQWQKLFEPEELERARARLKQYDYVPRASA
jgi:hypothetical protein